jgi:hypothetical protein
MNNIEDLMQLLGENKNIPFVDRILSPQNYGVIENKDNTISTHLMSAEYDENGDAYAFPMIVKTENGLRKFNDPREALNYNKKIGNVMKFNTIEEADMFSRNYKTPEFKQYYDSIKSPKGLLQE